MTKFVKSVTTDVAMIYVGYAAVRILGRVGRVTMRLGRGALKR